MDTPTLKAGPGRRPKGTQAMTDAQRARDYRARVRERETQRLKAEEAERQRVEAMKLEIRRTAGRILLSTITAWNENRTNHTKEQKDYMRRLGEYLHSGNRNLP